MIFLAAPVLTFAYGVIRILDGLDGSRGPGLAWTTGHLSFLAALILFLPILWRLRHLTAAASPPSPPVPAAFSPAPPVPAAFSPAPAVPAASVAAPPRSTTSGMAHSTAAPTTSSARSTAATTSAVVASAGVLALIAQFGIDIVVGWIATDKAHMSALFDRVQDVPGLTPIVYTVGPSLFYIGLFALSVLARRGVWLPILVGVNTALPLISKDLIPLAAVCLFAAFWPLRTITSPQRAR